MITFGSFLRLLSFALFCLVASSRSFAAVAPDEQFVTVYSLSQEADALNSAGKKDEALKKYQQAQNALLLLRRENPNWNTKVVASRLSDLSTKIAVLTQPPADEPVRSVSTNVAARPGTAVATRNGTVVKLLEAGAEPRRVLRFRPKAGQVQTSVMTIKMAMEMELGGMPGQSTKIPPMQLTLESSVKSVGENGDISYQSVVKDVGVLSEEGVPAEMVEMMKSTIEEMKGLTTTGVLTERGFSKDTEVKLPGELSPQVQQGMEQAREMLANMNTPVPEEAVGTGARWETTMPLKTQGMTIRQTITQQVVSMEGDTVKVSTAIQQAARNQKISNPAMPGVKLDVPQMSSKGTGGTTLDLGQLMPIDSSAKVNTQMTMSMNMGGQRQNMGMKMDMEVSIQEKK